MGSNAPNNGPAANSQPTSGGVAAWFARHPRGFWFIFSGELAERASFYGMKAILALYMTDRLGISKADTGTYVSLFLAAAYFLPLLGGFVADRYFGKYWTIVGFSLPYILGQVTVGIPDLGESFLGIPRDAYLVGSLVLLAMGSGVIKPNISTLMGLTYDQQRPGQDQLRTEAFSMFYAAINIGSAMSTLIMPWLRTKYGYFFAFLFPAVLMCLAFAIFALGKKYYAVEVISRTPPTPEVRAQQWAVLSRLMMLFLLVTFFWAIFDQHSSTWIFFAREYLDLSLFGWRVEPDQVQSLNPIFIVTFLPFVTWLWAALNRRGIHVRATDKMTAGFLLTAGTMAIHAAAGYLAVQNGVKVSLWWQVFAFVVITLAEILISVTGLELAFTAAPKSMKGFVTGCWLVTVACANFFINAPVTRLYPSNEPGWHFETPFGYFATLTAMMLVVTFAFVFVARQFNRSAEQPEVPAAPEGRSVTSRAPAEA